MNKNKKVKTTIASSSDYEVAIDISTFDRNDLKTGLFVLHKALDWGIIVKDKIVYQFSPLWMAMIFIMRKHVSMKVNQKYYTEESEIKYDL